MVLKRTVTMWWFFWAPKCMFKLMDKKIFTILWWKMFPYRLPELWVQMPKSLDLSPCDAMEKFTRMHAVINWISSEVRWERVCMIESWCKTNSLIWIIKCNIYLNQFLSKHTRCMNEIRAVKHIRTTAVHSWSGICCQSIREVKK